MKKLFSIIVHKQCRVSPKIRGKKLDEPYHCFGFLPADISGLQSRKGTHAEQAATLSLGDTIRIWGCGVWNGGQSARETKATEGKNPP